MSTTEPIYQLSHEKFILCFYAADLTSQEMVKRAAEERIRGAYRLRHLEPPATLPQDVERIAAQVVNDMKVAPAG